MGRTRTSVAVLAVFVAAALLATYPLVLRPTHAIAGGLGDPILNATVLAWDADRARNGFSSFWDAPFLYPHRHTLAYAEHLIGVAVFTTPLEWLSGNPVLTYNVAYVGSYVLAGFGMFLLVRHLWGRTDAAVLAGLAFALTPYRYAQTTHLQVLLNGWMPIGLLALHRYFETGRRRWLAAFAAAYVLLGLSNGYYLYFFLVPVAVVCAVEMIWPQLPRRRALLDLAATGIVIAAAIAPVALVYYQLQRDMGFRRSPEELAGLSAQLADYFRVATGAPTWGGLLRDGEGERQLFHGFVVMVFAAIGVSTWGSRGSTERGPDVEARRRAIVTYAAITILAVWFSLGPGPWRIYGLLFHVVPGLNGLRVPARLAAVVVVGLAALSGAGFAWLFERLTVRTASVAAIALAAVVVLEGQHGLGLSETPRQTDRSWDHVAYEWLRQSPPGAAIELNISQTDDFHPFTTLYQLNAVWHGHPIVNGYGGWKSLLQEFLGSAASPLREPAHAAEVVKGLRTIGVRYMLLHEATFSDSEELRRLLDGIRSASSQMDEERRWPETWAWRLKPATLDALPTAGGLRAVDPNTLRLRASVQEERIRLAFDGDIDTRWLSGEPQSGGEWIEIGLLNPADVARLRFSTGARSLFDYPRLLTVESVAPSGAVQTLFDGSIVDRLIEGMAFDERRTPIVIDLPPNRTATLRLRQRGTGHAWWTIHEIDLWARAER